MVLELDFSYLQKNREHGIEKVPLSMQARSLFESCSFLHRMISVLWVHCGGDGVGWGGVGWEVAAAHDHTSEIGRFSQPVTRTRASACHFLAGAFPSQSTVTILGLLVTIKGFLMQYRSQLRFECLARKPRKDFIQWRVIASARALLLPVLQSLQPGVWSLLAPVAEVRISRPKVAQSFALHC
jgi:hypothetical protein